MKTYQFTFSDKESYLQFRVVWKAEYKELSSKIREAKASIKTSNRLFNPYENDYQLQQKCFRQPSVPKIDLKSYWKAISILGEVNRDYLKLKEMATEALEILQEAKKEAQKQYLSKRL